MVREYRNILDAGITLGVQIHQDVVRIAIVLCNDEDNFSRETGRHLIDLLFDASDSTLKAINLKRNVFSFKLLNASMSVHDVLVSLNKFLSGDEVPNCEESINLVNYLQDRRINRFISETKKHNILTVGEAREFALFKENAVFEDLVESILEDLNEDQQEDFKQETDLDGLFFDYRGSAQSLIGAVKKFCRLMKKVKLETL